MTNTVNKNLNSPAHGSFANTWDVPVNQNWADIDAAFGGSTALSVTGLSGIQALTATQYTPPNLIISGTLTANVNYQLPATVGGVWSIANNTTGAFALTFSSAAGGPSVTLAPNTRTLVIADGTASGVQLAFSTTLPNYTFLTSIAALMAFNTAGISLVTVAGFYGPGTAGGGDLAMLAAPTTANGVTIFNDANGNSWKRIGVNGTVQVEMGGAVGNGSTDDTASINGVLSYLGATGGGTALLSSTTYKVAGTLVIPSEVVLAGCGRFSSTINFNNAALDCVTMAGTSGSPLIGCALTNLQLSHTSKTGGRTLIHAFCNRSQITNVQVTNCWTGFEIWVNNDLFIENVEFQGVTGGASIPASHYGAYAPQRCYGMWWHAPGDGSAQAIQLTTYNFTVNALYSGADGFVWDGFATTWNGDQVTVLDTHYGYNILNTAASNAFFPQFATVHNLNTDGASSISMYIQGGSLMYFTGASIQNTSGSSGQGGADTNALKILADSGASFTNTIKFVNGKIGLSKTEAASIAGRNIALIGMTLEAGSTQSTNTQPAIHLLSPAQDCVITGCESNAWGNPVSWQYGLLIDSGVLRTSGHGNNFSLAATKEIQNNSSDAQTLLYGNLTSQSGSTNPASIGLVNSTTVTVSYTETGANFVGGGLELGGTPGAFTMTTPTAAQIVAALPNPVVGALFDLYLINGTNGLATVAPGSGVSLSGNLTAGNFTIATGTSLLFKIRINVCASGSEAATVYG